MTTKQQGIELRKKADNFMSEVAKRQQSFARLLPKGMDPEWFVGEVRVALVRAPNLMECDPVSVFDALTTCAQLGLSPSGRLGSAYLIPFRDTRANTYRCTLVVGYKGYVDLAYRSGDVMGFGAQVVYENEPFDVTEGFDIAIHKHERDVETPGELRAVYAWATLRGGYSVKVLMWKREVLAIKARSRGASSGPWSTDEAEMWKKTAIRRLIKLLPLSPQKAAGLVRAQEVEDAEWEDASFDVEASHDDAAPSGTEGLKKSLKARNAVPEVIEPQLATELNEAAKALLKEKQGLPISHPDAQPPEPGSEG